MFDISTVNKRFLEVKLDGVVYQVEPCSVKTVKKLQNIDRSSENALEILVDLIIKIINKNIKSILIEKDSIEDLSIDELFGFLTAYMEWLSGIQNSPNL